METFIMQSVLLGSLVYLGFVLVNKSHGKKKGIALIDHLDQPIDITLYRRDSERFGSNLEKKEHQDFGDNFFSVHSALLSSIKDEYTFAPIPDNVLSYHVEKNRSDYNPVNTEM
jgi:hypothetical protein